MRVPVVVAAEPLGMLVLAAEAAEPLDADSRRLLRAISAAMGLRAAARPARGGAAAAASGAGRLAG